MGSPSCGMDGSRSVKFRGLLQALLRHEVDFLVVGGVAAQVEGAPIVTFDPFEIAVITSGAYNFGL